MFTTVAIHGLEIIPQTILRKTCGKRTGAARMK